VLGLAEPGREEIRAAGLVDRWVVGVGAEPGARDVVHPSAQRAVAHAERVVAGQQHGERRVLVRAGAHGIPAGPKKGLQSARELRGQRAQSVGPARRIVAPGRIRARARLVLELQLQLQQPRPAIGPLERAPARRAHVRELARDQLGAQVAFEAPGDRPGGRQAGRERAQAQQRPVHMHARVPVEAAVEDRMHRSGQALVGLVEDQVIELVREAALDARERAPRQGLGMPEDVAIGGIQGGHGGPVRGILRGRKAGERKV
jgi:hypothetical protein